MTPDTGTAFCCDSMPNTLGRLENIRQRCGRISFDPPAAKRFLWLADSSLLGSSDPLTYRWRSLDPTDDSHYSIAPGQ